MTHPALASPAQRITAAFINLVIGGLPVVIPKMMFPVRGSISSWTGTEINLLAGALVICQLAFVHFMQGSPGAIFCGLRVQNLDGSRPAGVTTLLRSIPYLALAIVIMAKANSGSAGRSDSFTLGAILILLFLGLSGVTALITGKHSLVDILTKTVVVKAYGSNTRGNRASEGQD